MATKKKLLIHLATDRNSGEFRRIYRLNKDFNKHYQFHTIEVILLPLFKILKLGEFKTNPLGSKQYILPIFLPFKRFDLIRRINTFIGQRIIFLITRKVNPDIIWGETLVSYNYFKSIKDVTKIIDFHGAYPDEVRYSTGNERYATSLEQLEDDALHSCNEIIVQSSAMEHYLSSVHKFNKKCVVYTCGVDTEFFDYRKVDIQQRKKIGYNKEDIIFTYVGGTHKWQLLEQVIDIFYFISVKLPNAKLLLILQGDIKPIEEKIHQKKLNTVQILRNIPFEEINQYLSLSDFGWLLRENTILNQVASPTKLGEYLSSGLTIISSEVATYWTKTKKDCFIICPIDNPSIAAQKIVSFQYDNVATRKENCRNLAITEFSSAKDAQSIAQILL